MKLYDFLTSSKVVKPALAFLIATNVKEVCDVFYETILHPMSINFTQKNKKQIHSGLFIKEINQFVVTMILIWLMAVIFKQTTGKNPI